MVRTGFIVLCLWMPLASCSYSHASESPRSGAVGTLGDPSRLVFEGVTTFSAEEIQRALMRSPDYLLASHPAAPLGDYLFAVKRLVLTGFQHNGFQEAQVTVAMDKTREKILVKVSEGPRYVCGEIEVVGAKTLPIELFVTHMTQPRLKKGKSDEADTPGQTETKDPIWQQGKPAPFSESSLNRLTSDIKSVLSELGYYFSTVTAEIVTTPGMSRARLIVRIEEEGSRTINQIFVTGNKKNTQAQILRYLGLEEGMLLDRALISKTENLLWRSARFLGYSVTPRADAARAVIRLIIDVREYEHAPMLSETFSPEETVLLKSCDWLSGFRQRQDDLMVTLDLKEIDIHLQIVISPTRGALIVVRDPDDASESGMINAAILTPERLAFFSPTVETKFGFPDLSTHISTSLSLLPNPDPKDDKLFVLTPGIAIRGNQSNESYNLEVKLAPVFFVSCAHKENVDVTALLDRGIVRFGTGGDYQVTLDTESGRLLEMTTHQSTNIEFALTMDRGLFDRMRETIEQTASGHRNAFLPQKPVGSAIQYLSETPLLHLYLAECPESQGGMSEEELARVVPVLGRVLGQAAAPLDRWVIKPRRVDKDHFKLPPRDIETTVSPTRMIVSAIAAHVFGMSNELFPPGSWPWTLAREAVFVVGGMGKYTDMELSRTYHSPQTGPIGYLAAAKLLVYVNQPLSRMFAAKGLERLSVKNFQNDFRLITEEDHLLAQCLAPMSQALRDLDDQDLEVLLAPCSQEQAHLIRESINRLHENEAQSTHQALAPVFERYWQNTLKTEVEKALRRLAAPATSTDK